eukprot:snap_masked-scaffold_28-processed-gene-1.27-mRNA-1 protein AED:1.00 eAED:1.00 QI:0/0/0/0/1/1/2/0/324
MKNLTQCIPPFLLDNENKCTSTVYEYYLPFSYYLQRTSTVIDFLILFGVLAVLISFLEYNRKHWFKCLRTRNNLQEEKDIFFKYNLTSIMLIFIGTIFHTHLCYNNFLYDIDYTSNLAKKNCVCIIFMAGLGIPNPVSSKIQYFSLSLAALNTLPFSIVMPFLIYYEKISLSSFILSCFLQNSINGILLSIVIILTFNTVIKDFKGLLNHYATTQGNAREMDKTYTFIIKLTIGKTAAFLHTSLLLLVAIPNLNYNLNTLNIVLLIDSIYLATIPIQVIPTIFFFSRFIIPVSDHCCSFKTDTNNNKVLHLTHEMQTNNNNLKV